MSFLRLIAAATAVGVIAAFATNRRSRVDDDDAVDIVPLGGAAAMIENEALSGAPSRKAGDQTSAGGYGTPNAPIL